MQILDPLTDLYSRKKRPGMLLNAINKHGPVSVPSAPVMTGPGIADMPQGYEEGGMLAGPIDWVTKNIVKPVQNLANTVMNPQPAITSINPPPTTLGTGYANIAGTAAQQHNAALKAAAGGYEEGGMIDTAKKWVTTHVVDPLTHLVSTPVNSTQVGTGYLHTSGEAAEKHKRDLEAAGKGFAESGAVNDPLKKLPATGLPAYPGASVMDYTPSNASGIVGDITPKQPVVATSPSWGGVNQEDVLKTLPHGASGSWEAPVVAPKAPVVTATPAPAITDTAVKVATAPMPVATAAGSDPLTNIDSSASGFAQVGQKRIGINDIGVKGKDPLTAGTGTINNFSEEEFKRSGLAADPNFGKTGYTFNTATKTWEKPDPTIMVGNPQGIMSTMKESEAFNKGLMSPHQRESYLNRQILEKQATLEAQVKGADIEEKKAIANWHNAQAAGGGGQPSAYKDVRIAEQAKMDAEGITDPVERNQRILAAEIDFKKKSSTASSRITQALDTKTGKVVPITGDDIKSNPGKYISASDPDVKSVTGITKSMDQIGAFSKGVDKSFDLVDKLSDAYSKRTIPGVNKFSQYLSYQAGDTQVKAFQNAFTTAMVEYMKVTNAGSGIGASELTIEGQKRAANLLSTADSPATIKNAIAVMKKEMDIKNAAFVGQRNEIYNRLGVTAAGAAPAPAAAVKIDMSKPVHNGQVQGYKQADGSILDANGKRLN